jgi:hypothetical protein
VAELGIRGGTKSRATLHNLLPEILLTRTPVNSEGYAMPMNCVGRWGFAIALGGVQLVWQYLPRAVADGSDLEARTQVMTAAIMGATACQKGLGAVHSLAHPCPRLP